MIAVMGQMSFTAKASNAKMERSSVNQATALLLTSGAMVIVIVEICLMKLAAHRSIQAVDTVPRRGSSATTTSVCLIPTFAMELMTAVTTQMKHLRFAPTWHAIWLKSSNATTRNAFQDSKYGENLGFFKWSFIKWWFTVTALTTVAMDLMRTTIHSVAQK